ncbi:MAG TPA: TIGR03067 domain-containing protein [Pirellulales bacterium]|nr:TIGR03067 domain-containing protein [Pirellulales bacterium]
MTSNETVGSKLDITMPTRLTIGKSFVWLLTAALCTSGTVLADDAIDQDLKKLSGTWTVIEIEASGMAPPADQMPKIEIIIEGNNLTIKDNGGPATKSAFTIDPRKTPKELDLNLVRPGEKVTVHCIYSVDGDQLKLAIPMFPRKGAPPVAGQEINKRPENFETKGKPLGRMVAKRKTS